MHKKIIFSVFVLSTSVFAQENLSEKQVDIDVKNTANDYIKSITCGGASINDIAPLIPYKQEGAPTIDAKYVVLWTGDIGCNGGSGTEGSHIVTVNMSRYNTPYVDASQSSPTVKFESPSRYFELLDYTHDTLILEGAEYAENDGNCCPSINIRFKMKKDEADNWALVEKKPLKKTNKEIN